MSTSSILKGIAAGAAGAIALTLLHQAVRRASSRSPRLDILGMRGLARSFRASGHEAPLRLYGSSLATDLVANMAYYSLAGITSPRKAVLTGSALGVAAGLGSILLPAALRLGAGPTRRTGATQAMTVGLYCAGGLVAGAVSRALRS